MILERMIDFIVHRNSGSFTASTSPCCRGRTFGRILIGLGTSDQHRSLTAKPQCGGSEDEDVYSSTAAQFSTNLATHGP